MQCVFTGDETGLVKQCLLGDDSTGLVPLRKRGNVVKDRPKTAPPQPHPEDRFKRTKAVAAPPTIKMATAGVHVVEGLEQTRAKGIIRLVQSSLSTVAALHRDGSLSAFDTALLRPVPLPGPIVDGTPVALDCLDSARMVSCNTDGVVNVWSPKAFSADAVQSFTVGSPVEALRPTPSKTCVAVGGRANDLCVWDVETATNSFTARNVKHDHLDMKVPIWITDIACISDNAASSGRDHVIATCTGHRHVRLYDTRVGRRPVRTGEYGTYPWKHLTHSAGSGAHGSMIVGSTTGQIVRVDLGTMKISGAFNGVGGAIKGLSSHASSPVFASVSLDRTMRVHSLRSRRVKHRVYLKQRLTAVLFAEDVTAPEPDTDDDSVFGDLEEVGAANGAGLGSPVDDGDTGSGDDSGGSEDEGSSCEDGPAAGAGVLARASSSSESEGGDSGGDFVAGSGSEGEFTDGSDSEEEGSEGEEEEPSPPPRPPTRKHRVGKAATPAAKRRR